MFQLKRKLVATGVALATALATLSPLGIANAQTSADAQYVSSVVYQNVSNAAATVSFTFYQPNGTAIPITRPQLAPGASSSLFLGSLTQLTTGFRGAAVLQSDQQVVAQVIQVPSAANPTAARSINRPASNGYSQGEARVLIPTVQKNPTTSNQITQISIQNTGSAATNLTVRYFAVGSATPAHTQTVSNLAPGAASFIDVRQVAELPAGFNGSATIEAAAGGTIVASALELNTRDGTRSAAFDGATGAGATTLYMPSAICRAFGGQQSAYAVQNVAASGSASVTVRYSSGQSETQSIPAGGKITFTGCGNGGAGNLNPNGFNGSATITSQGGNIVAIGKVFGGGRSTAYSGVSTGSARVAIPYVRYATTANFQTNSNNDRNQRTFIAIQNIGSTPLAAGAVTVRYIDPNGQTQGTPHALPAIPAGGKVNSDASNAGLQEFGYAGGGFGGGAIIEGPAGSQLVVIPRTESRAPGTGAGLAEDVNAFAIP